MDNLSYSWQLMSAKNFTEGISWTIQVVVGWFHLVLIDRGIRAKWEHGRP